MNTTTFKITNLEPGKRYVFHTQPWETPEGEIIPGKAIERMFVDTHDRGPVGMPSVPFVKVERNDGTQHLIAVETIARVEPVTERSLHHG